jgi:hypothetical protein
MNNQERRVIARANFRARVEAQGGTVLGEYTNIHTPIHIRCSAGHDGYPWPSSVQQGNGICKTCAENGAAAAAATRFRANVEALGGTVLGEWVNNRTTVHVRCAAGHDCYLRADSVRSPNGSISCMACYRDYHAMADAFKSAVETLGGTVLGEYVNTNTPVHVRCVAGHERYPRPGDVKRGDGICKICAGNDSAAAETAFRAQVVELGGTVLGDYVNKQTPVHIRCAQGHDCYPQPGNVRTRKTICRTCAGLDPIATEAAFRRRVKELGGTVLGEYVNSQTKVHVRCSAGHDRYPVPNRVNQGFGFCITCAGQDTDVAEAAFRARVNDQGGTVLGPWINSQTRVHVRCRAGHDSYPRPSHIQQGIGICAKCAGKIWDVFYIVTGTYSFKLGITSGDPRPRLYKHQIDGYTAAARLFTGLPDGVARSLEIRVLKDLATNGYKPVLGREYFGIEALPLVLSIVDAFSPPLSRAEVGRGLQKTRQFRVALCLPGKRS